MIVSSGTKKPKIHSSAYVAASATLSGDVTIGAGCAVLHGAVIVAEGAPVTIGSDTVVMENAVLKASGGSAVKFPLIVGNRCIVGPHAYVVGATIGNGCFIASGSRVFNGATMEEDSGIALGGILHVNSRLPKGASVPMQHIAHGNPATIYPPDKAPDVHAKIDFYADVFNLEGDGVRAQAAQAYSKFLRKMHAQDKQLDEHKNSAPPPRRSGEEPPQTQVAQVDKVVDVMMLELEEMEHRRQEAIKRKKL
jgi:carbonic anhydrase/acetyltransferase-like protein (isoleucine patch superfamily)